MTRLLKRWAALLVAIAWIVIFVSFLALLIPAGIYWLVTGHNISKYGDRALVFLFETYWGKYKDWAKR